MLCYCFVVVVVILAAQSLLTLSTHAQEGYSSRPVCLFVCLSVCLSPTL